MEIQQQQFVSELDKERDREIQQSTRSCENMMKNVQGNTAAPIRVRT
jgi:hypothetical protein